MSDIDAGLSMQAAIILILPSPNGSLMTAGLQKLHLLRIHENQGLINNLRICILLVHDHQKIILAHAHKWKLQFPSVHYQSRYQVCVCMYKYDSITYFIARLVGYILHYTGIT